MVGLVLLSALPRTGSNMSSATRQGLHVSKASVLLPLACVPSKYFVQLLWLHLQLPHFPLWGRPCPLSSQAGPGTTGGTLQRTARSSTLMSKLIYWLMLPVVWWELEALKTIPTYFRQSQETGMVRGQPYKRPRRDVNGGVLSEYSWGPSPRRHPPSLCSGTE